MHQLNNKQLVIAGVVLILVAAIVAFVAGVSPSLSQSGISSNSQTLPSPTPPTQQQLEQLQNTPPFQYLVSYTNSGFEPSQLTVKEGQTIRFANNSSGQVWIASVGIGSNPVYPGGSSCNGSTFDSCGPVDKGSYWEFTFTQAGTWSFENKLDKSKAGTVVVETR